MIKLTKGDQPSSLATNSGPWTTDLMDYINKGKAYKDVPKIVREKYIQKDIKDSLLTECHNKCMYCESDISGAGDYHIEHYRPKSIYPNKSFDWSNLGIACPKCNRNKGDNFNEEFPCVNPYIDCPDDFFAFAGTMVLPLAGNHRALLTNTVLGLNRPSLIEKRGERMKVIQSMADNYVLEPNLIIKDIRRKQLAEEISEDKPYSRCMKEVVKSITREDW